MKILHNLLGLICCFAIIIILLITSIEAVSYWTPGYYEMEYTKYNVTEAVNMEMDDLLYVTQEMMSYLRGDRPNLYVMTTMGGVERQFFNAREILHMEDVKDLFIGGLWLRRISIGIALGCFVLLVILKAKVKRVVPRMFQVGTSLFFLILALLCVVISTDFTKYFIIFHKIFFNNDMWVLNPSTDMLINIVPEPFFVDTALRIGVTFGLSVLILFIISTFILKFQKK